MKRKEIHLHPRRGGTVEYVMRSAKKRSYIKEELKDKHSIQISGINYVWVAEPIIPSYWPAND